MVVLRNPKYSVLTDLMNGKKAYAKNGNENKFEKRKYKNGERKQNENIYKNDEKSKRIYNSVNENINKNENIIQNEYNTAAHTSLELPSTKTI